MGKKSFCHGNGLTGKGALHCPLATMYLRLLTFLFCAFLPALVHGADTLRIDAGTYTLGRHFEFYREVNTQKPLTEIISRPFAANNTGKEAVNFGYTKDSIWVRFSVTNAGKQPLWYLRLGTLVDRVTLWQKDGKTWKERSLRRFEPFGQREVFHRDLIFALQIAPGATETIYMRFESAGNVTVQLDLTDAQTFAAEDHDSQFAFGLYFGLMFIMVGYNFFLFLATRDRAYLWYVCYAFTFTLLHLSINGYIAEYVWPRDKPLPHLFTPLFISVSGVFSVLFTRKILALEVVRGHMDLLSRILFLLFASAVAAAFVAPYTMAMRAATYATLISIAGLTYCGIRRWLQGQRSARFFLMGWGALYAGIAAMLLRNLGILSHNFFTAYAMQIFSAVEVTLFSLALGDRLNQLREDSQKLQEVKKELELARKMQLALVPPVTLNAPRVDIAHRYIPMLDVGGDFMDIRITEDGVSIFIGDVSGHGISAAMIATTMKLSLDTEGDSSQAPDARMKKLNGNIGELPDSAFVTACSAYFLPHTGELTISSAGHPPVVIYHAKNKKCTRYKARGMPLGVRASSHEYSLEIAQLSPDDIVLFYTDGIVEEGVTRGQEFGLDRIEDLLIKKAALPAHEISEHLLHELEVFSGKKRLVGFEDDVAFVILKVTGSVT